MFTTNQTKDAHAKVKIGANFPAYVQGLIQLGIKKYDTYAGDAHSIYLGENDLSTASEDKYSLVAVAAANHETTFRHYLKIHQQGEIDDPKFCQYASVTGIYKWTVDLQKRLVPVLVNPELKFL